MRPKPSVHDNFVYAYSVDCEARRLVLHTAYRDHDPHEFTDVVFLDVVAHHFDHVLAGNILMDVEQVDVAALVKDNEALLSNSWRWGWPPLDYKGDLDVLARELNSAAVLAFEISASYGLSGWVLAGACDRVTRSEAARVA
jgi:hypothetical protein